MKRFTRCPCRAASLPVLCAIGFLLHASGVAGALVSPKAGFPATVPGVGIIRAGHPAVADLGLTPGHKSIVFGTSGNKLVVVKYDGSIAWVPVDLPAESAASPVVADVDGDGIPDIVIAYGSTFEPAGVRGGVSAFTRDGRLLWSRPCADFGGGPGKVVGSPVVADFNGDGKLEVAWGGSDAFVYLVNGADGTNLPGWPIFVRDTVRSSPAAADIDGDGRPDVVIGVDAHKEQSPFNTPDGGCLHVYRYDASEVVGFPRCIDQVISSSPAIGDIDGDGRPEIVVGTGTYWPNATHAVYAWKCDGTLAAGWPVAVEGQVETSPALADVNGDGRLDVVVTDNNNTPSTTFHVYAFLGDGRQLWKTIPRDYWGFTLNAGDPIVADVLGDAKLEVLLPTNTEICVLDALTGRQLTDDGTKFPGSVSYFVNTSIHHAVVDDLEGGGTPVELIAVSADAATTSANALVYIWNPKSSSAIPWGAFHQNAARTGVYPGTPSCGNSLAPEKLYTLQPCRILDTRNPDGPYGGPSIPAQQVRTFMLAGQCGIPSDARSVALNVTVVGPTFDGDLRVFPGQGASPLTSVINYRTGQTRANNTVMRLGAGQISIQNDQGIGTTNVLVDVNGYFK